MTTAPVDPLVPADVDLRDFGYMPLPARFLTDGALACETNDRVFRTVLRLMEMAWRGRPAASLKDYGPRWFRAAGESPAWWKRHGANVLSHFVLCSDGRYYSRPLAEQVRRITQGKRRLDVSVAMWAKLRADVFERDGHACVYCRSTTRTLDCDHVVPLSRGGRSNVGNLVTACSTCNRSKGARTPAEWIG